ncbi:hypothetical protein D9758_004025 [Tetrapyrgos nigripes]|uniref:F-box domain-containing protein n=1 Tax=Tetrapyrgos nigripes TaxID=182062 RepID=A0A8H5GLF2_9AGAR|nr:hypothetical protein D9758_004025 [Tetrapyrgos nigripes]
MHHALEIPELLGQIFEYLSANDRKRCVPVCRLFSEIVLDQLWEDVEHERVVDFARLFAPVKKVEDSYMFESESLPTIESWTRFRSKYSKRIRCLHLDYDQYPVSAVLKTISVIRPSFPILPNLHTLKIRCSPRYELMDDVEGFIHDGVQVLSISCFGAVYRMPRWPSCDVWRLHKLASLIQLRFPNLTSLEITIPWKEGLLEKLVTLLGTLPSLKCVSIPSFRNTSDILSTLSSSTDMRSLEFSSILGKPTSRVGNPWLKDRVSSLEHLKIHVAEYRTFFPLLPHLCHLRALHLTIDGITTDCKVLFDHISQCLTLDTLSVHLHPHIAPAVKFDALANICACSNMVSFTFESMLPIDMSDSDIAHVAQSWPRLQQLELGWSCLPSVLDDEFAESGESELEEEVFDSELRRKKTSLWAVFLLSHSCPNLSSLKLFINTKPDRTPSFDDASLPLEFQHSEAANINEARFGFDFDLEAGDEITIAQLLGQLLKPQCILMIDGFEDDIELEDLVGSEALDTSFDSGYEIIQNLRWKTALELFPHFSEPYWTIQELKKQILALQSAR